MKKKDIAWLLSAVMIMTTAAAPMGRRKNGQDANPGS